MSAVLMNGTLRSLRVLILDDNSGDRALYKHMLAEADPGTRYEFFEAESGHAALEITQRENPDCILLDYVLPDMLGLDFLQAMVTVYTTSQKPVPPVVMLTGFGDEATVVKAMQSGAHGYIPKRGLNGKVLLHAIDRAIRAHREQQQLDRTRHELALRNRELESKYQQIEGFYQKILGKLRQPVSSLREQMAELLANEPAAFDRRMHKQLLDLRVESERLAVTLNNLMDNPCLDAGQLLVSPRPEPVMEVIAGAVNAFRPVAEAAGVRLSVKIQPGLPDVPMDRYRIEQVLVNVLDNAVKFTPPEGRIFLRVDRFPESSQEITISVSDTGKGIPCEQLEGLFDQESPSVTTGPEELTDSGIGLRVCREIIQSHKGRISVESLPEAGTSVTFTLPLEVRQARPTAVWEGVAKLNGDSQWALSV